METQVMVGLRVGLRSEGSNGAPGKISYWLNLTYQLQIFITLNFFF